jgi:elongation factor Ts
MITLEKIQELRKRTSAPLIDCKNCLEEAGGDIERAILLLRKKGLKSAAKKGDRETLEGCIGSYVHTTGKVAAMAALACETDFVARTDEFKILAKDLAMQITASAPAYIKPSDIPQEVIDKEKEIYRAQLVLEKKPFAMIEKILEGKLEKFYAETCLLRQPFIKDDKKTVGEIIKEHIVALGENIEVKEMARMSL